MRVPSHEIDPLTDARWRVFLAGHPRASVFHTPEWLEAVRRTYGYRPAVLTTSGADEDLANGLVFCRVQSWLTGRRLVSVPFSDHCDPLVTSPEDVPVLLQGLEERARTEGCKYAELRPVSPLPEIHPCWRADECYYHHFLDLRAGAEALLHQFDRDCIQRRIRHASRSGITVMEGRGLERLKEFYTLVLKTRRRQGLPPQPMRWYRNLVDCLGDSVTIRCAYNGDQPIAAILTLRYKNSLYYKYSASIAQFHRFGAVPYLLWRAIQGAISQGLEQLDLGRSDYDAVGLVAFKRRWNAKSLLTSYLRCPTDARQVITNRGWVRRLARTTCKYMPDTCLAALGNLAYRHVG